MSLDPSQESKKKSKLDTGSSQSSRFDEPGEDKNIKFRGNLKHIVITPEVASMLTNEDPH